jgi:hypothetical protein
MTIAMLLRNTVSAAAVTLGPALAPPWPGSLVETQTFDPLDADPSSLSQPLLAHRACSCRGTPKEHRRADQPQNAGLSADAARGESSCESGNSPILVARVRPFTQEQSLRAPAGRSPLVRSDGMHAARWRTRSHARTADALACPVHRRPRTRRRPYWLRSSVSEQEQRLAAAARCFRQASGVDELPQAHWLSFGDAGRLVDDEFEGLGQGCADLLLRCG